MAQRGALAALLTAALAACSGARDAPPEGGQPARAPEHAPPRPDTPGGWASKLGQTVTLEGEAADAKLGALLQVEPGGIWIDGHDAWPPDVAWKRVQVTGTLIERYDLPVFVREEGVVPNMAGIPVPPGTDLRAASRRFLLANARWKRVD